jgi:hypothetical protein
MLRDRFASRDDNGDDGALLNAFNAPYGVWMASEVCVVRTQGYASRL